MCEIENRCLPIVRESPKKSNSEEESDEKKKAYYSSDGVKKKSENIPADNVNSFFAKPDCTHLSSPLRFKRTYAN